MLRTAAVGGQAEAGAGAAGGRPRGGTGCCNKGVIKAGREAVPKP